MASRSPCPDKTLRVQKGLGRSRLYVKIYITLYYMLLSILAPITKQLCTQMILLFSMSWPQTGAGHAAPRQHRPSLA